VPKENIVGKPGRGLSSILEHVMNWEISRHLHEEVGENCSGGWNACIGLGQESARRSLADGSNQ